MRSKRLGDVVRMLRSLPRGYGRALLRTLRGGPGVSSPSGMAITSLILASGLVLSVVRAVLDHEDRAIGFAVFAAIAFVLHALFLISGSHRGSDNAPCDDPSGSDT